MHIFAGKCSKMAILNGVLVEMCFVFSSSLLIHESFYVFFFSILINQILLKL
jgi:hypothetical protein